MILVNCLDESIHQRFSLCEWPIKYDGNEHLSSIFFEGWSAGLHLLQDCYCFVLTKVFVPTPL